MDSERALQLYRERRYCYHGIIGSPVRADYLESTDEYHILYMFYCTDPEGGHPHVHYLFLADQAPATISKRFQRVERVSPGTYSRLKHVSCEDYFMGCIHYFHCPRGQTGHKHDFTDGISNNTYFHLAEKGGCSRAKESIRRDIKLNHPGDCPCIKRREKWQGRMRYLKKEKAAEPKTVNTESGPVVRLAGSTGPIKPFDQFGKKRPPKTKSIHSGVYDGAGPSAPKNARVTINGVYYDNIFDIPINV